MKRKYSNSFLASITLTLAAISSSQAADRFWDTNSTTAGSGAATGTWGTNLYWSTNSAGTAATANTTITAADDVFFSAGTNGTAGTVTIGTTKVASSITFDDNVALTLSGGTSLTIGGTGAFDGIRVSSGNNAANSIATALVLASGANTINTTGTGVLTLSGGITGSQALILDNDSTNTAGITINGSSLNNGGSVTNSGSGSGGALISSVIGTNVTSVIQNSATSALTLSGANLYTGATTITAGVLRATTSSAFGTVAGGVSVAAAGALELNGSGAIGAEALSLNAAGISNGGALRNISGNNSWAGVITLGNVADQTVVRINSDADTLTIGAGGITETGNNVKALTFGGAGNVAVTGIIGGGADMRVVKDGAGKLTLSGTNTYTGGTTITGGTVSISADSNLGTSGGITISGGATLQTTGTMVNLGARTISIGTGGAIIDASVPIYVGGVISNTGGGGLTTSGNDFILNKDSATNNNIGTINVNGGRFFVQGRLNNVNGSTINVADGAIFATQVATPGTLANTINFASGGGLSNRLGTLTIGASATLPTAGKIVFNNDDTDTSAAAITVTGNRSVTANLEIQVGGSNLAVGAVTFEDVISGSGGITKTSTGLLTLSGANTYTGATNVNGGTLKLGTTGTFGVNSAVTVNAGTLDIAGFNTQIGSLNGAGGTVVLGANTLTVGGDNTSPAAFAGVISGTGSVTKIGSGVLTLSGANSYTGATTINAGTVNVATIGNSGVAGTLGTATNVVLGGGSLQYAGASASTNRNFILSASTTSTLDITTNNLTVSGASTATNGGLIKTGAGTLTLTGNNLHTGLTVVNGGTLSLNRNGGALTGAVTVSGGSLDVAQSDTVGAVTLSSGTISGAGTLTSTSSYSLTNTGSVSASLAGSVDLTKTGGGIATLSGANTYSGMTTVSNGRLLANNTTGSATGISGVSVTTGGILGGTGTITPGSGRSIDIASGGILAPGASIGNLTLNLGSTALGVTMASGSEFELELGLAGSDIGAVGTSDLITLASAAAGDFAFNGNTIDLMSTGEIGFYKLFDTSSNNANTWTGLTVDGTGLITDGLNLTNVASGYTGKLIMGGNSFGGTAGDIYLQVVPEPSAALLGGIGALLLLRRRRN